MFLYLLKFTAIFSVCYFGTQAVIGVCAPGKYYSQFANKHLDYISALRSSFLHAAKLMTGLFGFETYLPSEYILRVVNGSGIKMVYSCLGIGVLSFWTAFVLANKSNWRRKLIWLLTGLFLLWLINVMRITFLLIANNKHWPMPFFDHHTWFNIIAYILIFFLIWLYNRQEKISLKQSQLRK